MSDQTRSRPTLPEGRRAVLYALRRRGQATADDIARQLDMTVSGARQHLDRARRRGPRRGDRAARGPPGNAGGPQLEYTVTDKADGLFPKAYGELTNELLGYVVGGRLRRSSTRCSSVAATSGCATPTARLAPMPRA